MKLHDLKPAKGARKKRTRVGRGIAAGKGKTAGRGTKGQKARSGGGVRPYFEGGQLPLVRRLPFKRGFTNIFRIEYAEVNLDQLEARYQAGEVVSPETMAERRLLRRPEQPVVILGRGQLHKSLLVQAHRFSKSAAQAIEAAGGSVERLELTVKGARATVRRQRQEQRQK